MEPVAQNVGLGGDGDEIAALQEVEEEFGVKLDYTDARDWTTVGDVYAALLRQLPTAEANEPDVWPRFAKAICCVTGTSASDISLESGLIAEDGLWVPVTNVSAFFWVALAVAGVVGTGWLLMRS
jgi:hypothetical protein